ncbi:hypothetical protein E0485_13070 [Paenibacillus albiflavus]|uniref:Uncharacterized protein n=1 Tax=Paenibacillus albiflavus TaxID=2545760 RepID=A0A4R4EA77_9BACL|nr:hypothetical protein [Paenibacillus albiflavus]TCZ76529.1 hypothetical protein E0485_13070 [Paenibacillus albiflavus]
MDWYTNESIAMINQARIEHHAKEQWKFKTWLQSRKNLLHSDQARLKSQAVDVINKHSVTRESKMTLTS